MFSECCCRIVTGGNASQIPQVVARMNDLEGKVKIIRNSRQVWKHRAGHVAVSIVVLKINGSPGPVLRDFTT
jgi:hypothetical protein